MSRRPRDQTAGRLRHRPPAPCGVEGVRVVQVSAGAPAQLLLLWLHSHADNWRIFQRQGK